MPRRMSAGAEHRYPRHRFAGLLERLPAAVAHRVLEAERHAAMRLTESFAMLPASAVSGFYLSHPESSYFAVGKIGRDQVEDYAQRARMSLAEAEKWLAPCLAYEPEAAAAQL